MILQSLAEYYERKRGVGDASLPPYGYEPVEIHFVIEINEDGELILVHDIREREGNRLVGSTEWLPQSVDRTGSDSWKTAFLLWDHPRYALGVRQEKESTDEMAEKRLESFKSRLLQTFPTPSSDKGVNAVWKFLEKGNHKRLPEQTNLWEEIGKTTKGVAFKLNSDRELVGQREIVQEAVMNEFLSGTKDRICLVTGEADSIPAIHPKTPVPGSKSTAKLVAFQKNSGYDSYGKEQCLNAPVGRKTTFAYTTALNHLLHSPQRMQVGDASTVFWSEKATDFETDIVNIFAESKKDDPDRNARAVEQLFKSVHNGRYKAADGPTRFYVLGLAPNSARIAVRFWHVATVGELAERIVQHFEYLRIDKPDYEDMPYPSLNAILSSTANETKFDSNRSNLVRFRGKYFDVKPNLAGDTMRAILEGLPYPQTLLGAAVRRIKAEQHVSYPRAALIKACINRATRYSNAENKEELKVSLDEQNTNIGYRLGRLFAVLEKIQEDSVRPGKLNTTIRDSSYGSASATPVIIFSRLIRLSNHHLSKIKKGEYPGSAVVREKEITSIMGGIDDFPTHLSLSDQGRFAIGYYHQRQNFFKKSGPKEMNDE